MGRHPRLAFSRPVRRSLTLRPAYSPRRQATCFLEGFDGFVTSTAAPIATGWSDPVAGWESHPLKNQTFHGARTCTASCANISVAGLGRGETCFAQGEKSDSRQPWTSDRHSLPLLTNNGF